MNNVNIERTLGRIEGRLDQILEEQKRDRLEFKEIKQRQDRAEKDRASMVERLKAVEGNTAEFNKWKERAIGAVMLISVLAALIGGTLASSWQKIVDVFR